MCQVLIHLKITNKIYFNNKTINFQFISSSNNMASNKNGENTCGSRSREATKSPGTLSMPARLALTTTFSWEDQKKNLAKSIWTSTSKSWDYLVSGISGSRQSGEMLLTNENCNWVKIKRGDIFPDNAIYSGLDVKSDKLLVGKTLGDGEPGKITCKDNSAVPPTMLNMWTDSGGN